jgi:hypothetical protein
VNHTELVAVNCDVLALVKFCVAVHQLPCARLSVAESVPPSVAGEPETVREEAESERAMVFAERSEVEMVVVEINFPPASVASSAPVSEVKYTLLVAVSWDEEAFVKFCRPVHQLVSVRSVEDAAAMVKVPPAVTAVLLMVASVPVRRLVPKLEVAMSLLFWSRASKEEAVTFVNQEEPALVNPFEVEALVKNVVDAKTMVSLSQSGVVVDWLATPLYEEGVNGHAVPPREERVRQLFDIAKQPPVRLMPWLPVEVAEMAKRERLRPPEKVDVESEPKVAAPVIAWKESMAVVEVALGAVVVAVEVER